MLPCSCGASIHGSADFATSLSRPGVAVWKPDPGQIGLFGNEVHLRRYALRIPDTFTETQIPGQDDPVAFEPHVFSSTAYSDGTRTGLVVTFEAIPAAKHGLDPLGSALAGDIAEKK